MTEQTRAPLIPFTPPLGLLNPLWPAYGLMMGASLHWWALSRLIRFASPVWAFDTKPTIETPVQAPAAEVAPAEVAPSAQAEAHVEPAPATDGTAEIAPAIEAEPALAAEAAFAPEIETFFAPEPTPEPVAATAPEPTPEPEAATAPEPAHAPELKSEAEAATASEATVGPGDVDELTLIRGIGPRVADALVERGVTTFRQLAQWTEKDMHHFDVEMKLLGRSKRYDFLGQAKALASEA